MLTGSCCELYRSLIALNRFPSALHESPLEAKRSAAIKLTGDAEPDYQPDEVRYVSVT